MATVIIRGRKIDQTKLRNYLDSIDLMDFEQDDGTWKSPITGEFFRTKAQLNGHIGAYLRIPVRKNVKEPSRRGYVRALRAGVEPTEEQRAAHREYNKKYRDESKDDGDVVVSEDRPVFEL